MVLAEALVYICVHTVMLGIFAGITDNWLGKRCGISKRVIIVGIQYLRCRIDRKIVRQREEKRARIIQRIAARRDMAAESVIISLSRRVFKRAALALNRIRAMAESQSVADLYFLCVVCCSKSHRVLILTKVSPICGLVSTQCVICSCFIFSVYILSMSEPAW